MTVIDDRQHHLASEWDTATPEGLAEERRQNGDIRAELLFHFLSLKQHYYTSSAKNNESFDLYTLHSEERYLKSDSGLPDITIPLVVVYLKTFLEPWNDRTSESDTHGETTSYFPWTLAKFNASSLVWITIISHKPAKRKPPVRIERVTALTETGHYWRRNKCVKDGYRWDELRIVTYCFIRFFLYTGYWPSLRGMPVFYITIRRWETGYADSVFFHRSSQINQYWWCTGLLSLL